MLYLYILPTLNLKNYFISIYFYFLLDRKNIIL